MCLTRHTANTESPKPARGAYYNSPEHPLILK